MNRIFLLVTFFFLHFSASAQNFLWGRNGGSSSPTQGIDDESVIDMATDQNGNVYILSYIFDNNPNVAGQTVPHFGFADVMVASFAPDGSVRWTKVIGTGSTDRPLALQTDKIGGVYIAASMNITNTEGFIDNDAIIPKTDQNIVLIKYDLNGNYQWYRLPQADTVTVQSWSTTGILDMSVDGNGNTYALAQLAPGIYGGSGGAVVTTLGDYILKYDASGNFTGIINIDLYLEDENGAYAEMALDETNQRFYIVGVRDRFSGKTVRMGSTMVSLGGYVASFDINGSFLWVKDNSLDYGGFIGRPVFDNAGNIFMVGALETGDNFGGYPVANNGGYTPLVAKMDKNGSFLWVKEVESGYGILPYTIALRNADEVMMSGSYARSVKWTNSTDTILNKPPNDAYDLFITRFSTSDGSVKGMDWISSTSGYNEYPTRMASDGNNNVYIGGNFQSDMKVNALNYLTSTGGNTDWFLIKYGNMWPDNVNSFVNDKDIVLYPNPAQNNVYIDKVGAGTTLLLKDMTGHTLNSKTLQSQHESLDLSAYPAGNYILELTDKNGGRLVKKVSKR